MNNNGILNKDFSAHVQSAFADVSSVRMKYGDDVFTAANLICKMDHLDAEVSIEDKVRLAWRIVAMSYTTDESRFVDADYVDAIVNFVKSVSVQKLLALDDIEFEAALVAIAQFKAETYADEEHKDPEVLLLDIYED